MKWLLFFITILSLSSCANYTAMHYTVEQNVPLFTQKNELRLSAATGTESYGFQAAYAITKSLALMGSYSNGLDFQYSNANSGDLDFGGTRMSTEFAVGYFKKLKDSTIIEIYGGAGRYQGDFQVTSTDMVPFSSTASVRTNCTEPFVQFDLGFQQTKHHIFSLSCKVGYLIYDHFYSYLSGTYLMPQSTSTITNPNASPNIVPCLTYRSYEKRLSFQAQAGLSTSAPMSHYDSGGDFFINFGLSLKLFGESKSGTAK